MVDYDIEFEYDAIAIDTSIFDRNKLKLDSGILARIKQFKESPIEVVLPDIVKDEIQTHLERKINETTGALHKSLKNAKQFLDTNSINLQNLEKLLEQNSSSKDIAISKLNSFIADTGITILDSDEFVNISDVTKSYFNSSAPFSKTGDKKSEFPDAIALNCLENWAEKYGYYVLVVSTDNDWKNFCSDSEFLEFEESLFNAFSIFNQSTLIYNFLNTFPSNVEEIEKTYMFEKIKDFIENEFEDFDPYMDASSALRFESDECYANVSSIKLFNTDGTVDFKVIDLIDDQIILACEISVDVNVEGIFNLYAYDSIDREEIYLGSTSKSKDESLTSEILITLTGSFESLDDMFIDEIELTDTLGSVDFGEISLDWDED